MKLKNFGILPGCRTGRIKVNGVVGNDTYTSWRLEMKVIIEEKYGVKKSGLEVKLHTGTNVINFYRI